MGHDPAKSPVMERSSLREQAHGSLLRSCSGPHTKQPQMQNLIVRTPQRHHGRRSDFLATLREVGSLLALAAELCCQPTRNIAPHISLHDLPYQKTVWRCLHQVSLSQVFFCCSCGNSGFEHIFAIVDNIFARFRTLVECNPNRHGQKMMLVLPNRQLS